VLLPRKAFNFRGDACFDFRELLISSREPQLVENDEGHNQDLEKQPKNSKWYILNGDYLGGLILKESGEHSRRISGASAET